MKQISTIILFFISLICIAQDFESNDLFVEYLEELSDYESSKFDWEEVADQLFSHKINLNEATLEDLATSWIFDEIDAYNIRNHRQKFGNFVTLYELKNIEAFNEERIKRILPFVCIAPSDQSRSFEDELKKGKHDVFLHYQQSLQQKKGYRSDSLKPAKYNGSPAHYYTKYTFQTSEKFSIGWTGEKDAGEPSFGHHNRGFDFNSFHIQFQNIGKISKFCIGDYKVNFGQGLVIGSGTMFGKSANTTYSFQQKEGIFRYTSTNEVNFLRGGGMSLSHKHITTSFFLSKKDIDCTINGNRITSFKTDGLHRTQNELSKKRNEEESVVGANLSYKHVHFQVGATFLFIRYSDTLSPTDKAYNKYRLRETDRHWNLGVNYKTYWKRTELFGEVATDANTAFASTSGLCIHPNSRSNWLLIHRMYQPEYQANKSNAFGEQSRCENETGIYIGGKILPLKRIAFSFYVDVFKFPWPRYTLIQPSKGEECLANLKYDITSKTYAKIQYKYKRRTEEEYVKQDLRYTMHGEKKSLWYQIILTGNKVVESSENHFGWVASNDIGVKIPRPQLSISSHYAFFSASNYNNRFYLYERDIPNCFSTPLLYGKGHRVGINLKYHVSRHIQLYLNYSTYIYTDGRSTTGSGDEEIDGNVSSLVKGLVKLSF